ncbi:MAG: hypothetical protein ABEH88_11040 [Halobacteriales archaeon]
MTMDTQVLVSVIAISVLVFGVGGFALGWYAGKRAYKRRMPALSPDRLDAMDEEESEETTLKPPGATDLIHTEHERDENDE